MKKFRALLLALIILPCCMLFTGCSLFDTETYVTGIERTSTIGDSEVYTVYYSDGKTSNFTVENGADGEDMKIEEIFDACVDRGLYTDDNDGFKEFLADYMTMEVDDTTDTEAINKAAMSAVAVYSHFTVTPSWNGATSSVLGCGAGVIYRMGDEYSYIITNYHVVYDDDSRTSNGIAGEIVVYQYGADCQFSKTNGVYSLGGDKVKCTYIGGSINYDIAVLRVSTADLTAVNPNVRAVDVADSYTVGETAIAIGNPEGYGISVTKGIVSVLSEEVPLTISDYVGELDYRVMRIDAAINGGNSGGGIFNAQGELIGILNSKSCYSSDGSCLEGMAYALPHDNITKVADNIIYNYEDDDNTTFGVNKLMLGITFEEINSRAIYNVLDGSITIKTDLRIAAITSTLASQKFHVGDIITAISINGDEHTIERACQFPDHLLTVRPGDSLLISVTREGVAIEPIEFADLSSVYFTTIS